MAVVRCYLLFYNVVLFLGWSMILAKLLINVCTGISPYYLYPIVAKYLKVFQTLAVFEIFHSIFGFVRSPAFTTALQVFSRLVILWPVTSSVLEAQSSVGFLFYAIAWSLTEVVRYSFYALTLLNFVPRWLQYLRYTLFIFLYPLGVFGELMTIVAALPAVKQRKIYCIDLPNAVNASFDFYIVLHIFMVFYLPFFPKLYCYMLSQRRKVLTVITPSSEDKRD